jgi:hypothetical protein
MIETNNLLWVATGMKHFRVEHECNLSLQIALKVQNSNNFFAK